MKRRKKIAICVSALFFHAQVFAAEAPRSVYKISPVVDGTIIGVTSLGSIIPQALNSHLISPRCPCNPGEVNGFDRPAIGNNSQAADVISDVTVGLSLITPPVLNYIGLGASREFMEDFVVYAQVLSVSGAFVTLSKYTVQRPIPLVYSGDRSPNDPNGYTSFYSGHTALTFAALSATAMTLDLRYQAGAWPWFIVAGVGGSVAYERVAAGKHFPTDVMMGALAGTLGGVLIPLFHARGQEPPHVTVAATGSAFSLSWDRRF